MIHHDYIINERTRLSSEISHTQTDLTGSVVWQSIGLTLQSCRFDSHHGVRHIFQFAGRGHRLAITSQKPCSLEYIGPGYAKNRGHLIFLPLGMQAKSGIKKPF